ncbi:MAG: RpiB/LacA/LacB family sugar-phosphate isomerase [Polyangiales bacterium]
MRIAICSDEPYPVHDLVRKLIEARGHSAVSFGSIATGKEAPWAEVAEQAAASVAAGECDEGVFFCWSGTGISMAANKVAGIRAALCADPGAARAARIWNHANVICLSNRTLSTDMAKEILEAWFDTEPGTAGDDGVHRLRDVDARHRKP